MIGIIGAMKTETDALIEMLEGKAVETISGREYYTGKLFGHDAVICTCGIGMIFLTPYMQASFAAFYDDITNRAAARETEFPSLNPDDYDPNGQW